MLLIKLQGSAKKFVPECLCAAATVICVRDRACVQVTEHVCVCVCVCLRFSENSVLV